MGVLGRFATLKISVQQIVLMLMEAVWLVMLFVLPLIFFPNIFTTFELAKVTVFQGAAVLLFLLWLLKYLMIGVSPGVELKSHRNIWICLAFFLGFYLLATLFSVAPAMSVLGWYPRFQGLLTFVNYLLFGMVIFFELRTPAQRDRLLLALMTSFLLVCGVAILQKVLPGFLQWWNDQAFNGRIYGTMANPNYLASYAVMIIPLCVANLFRKKYRIFSWALLILGIVTLGFTLSREGFLALFAAILFFLLVVSWRRHAKKTFIILSVLPFVVGAFVWYVVAHPQESWIQNIPFVNRLTASEENMTSAQTRLEIWPAVVRQILASPLFGYGPETLAVTFPVFAPATVNTNPVQGEIVDHAHNELLDWGVQIGIPGMIAYLLFILALIVEGGFAKVEKNEHDSWFILGFSSSILGLFIANEFGFSVTVQWVLLTTFAAVMLNILHQKDFKTVEYHLGKLDKVGGQIVKIALFALVAVLSVGMFLIHGVGYVLADAKMRQAYDLIGIQGASEADNIGNAIDTVGFTPEIQHQVDTIMENYRAAAKLAPTEAFYSLEYAYMQEAFLYDGEKISSVQMEDALISAFHAARLRGYDGFSISIAQQFKNTF